jgi:hypothetical protein
MPSAWVELTSVNGYTIRIWARDPKHKKLSMQRAPRAALISRTKYLRVVVHRAQNT